MTRILTSLGVVHKLRWQVFGFFWPPPLNPHVDIFYLWKVDKKLAFLENLEFVENVGT